MIEVLGSAHISDPGSDFFEVLSEAMDEQNVYSHLEVVFVQNGNRVVFLKVTPDTPTNLDVFEFATNWFKNATTPRDDVYAPELRAAIKEEKE